MCKVSDQIKLCTCSTTAVQELKHYWVLSRPAESDIVMMGLTVLPANIGDKAHELNEQTIMQQLNKGNCFDKDFEHQDDDLLELHFTFNTVSRNDEANTGHGNFLAYSFKHADGKWTAEPYDPFVTGLIEIDKGEIVNPFSRNT